MRTAISRRRVLAGAASLSAAGMWPGRPAEAASDMLSFGMAPYPPHLKPFETAGNAANAVKLMIYRGLMAYDGDGKLIPELAQSVAVEGPTIFRFELRPGATFHNGDPVTSEDVRYSYDAIRAPSSPAFLREDMAQIAQIETPDPKTVRITLKAPNAAFLALTASYHAPIIAKTSPSPETGIGAGPYRIVTAERGQALTLERVANFYKPGRPRLSKVRFVNYNDGDLRVSALRAGDVDIIQNVPFENIEQLEKEKGLHLDTVSDGAFFYLTYNCVAGPFADARLRRAVALGIDRQEVVDAVCFGYGRPMEGLPIPGGNPFGDSPAISTFTYDPDRAKALLKEAGFPAGLTVKLLVSPESIGHRPCAEIVQAQLAKIGIKVEMTMAEWGKRLQMGVAGQYEFSVYGTQGISNDPDGVGQFIGTASPNQARSFGFSNPKVDSILAAGRQELDPEKRLQIYDELHRISAIEAPFCGLCWRMQPYAMNRKVKNFRNMPAFLWAYSPMTIEDVELTG